MALRALTNAKSSGVNPAASLNAPYGAPCSDKELAAKAGFRFSTSLNALWRSVLSDCPACHCCDQGNDFSSRGADKAGIRPASTASD